MKTKRVIMLARNKIIFLFVLFCLSAIASAQERSLLEDLDSLQRKYSYYPDQFPKPAYTPPPNIAVAPPPPPLGDTVEKNDSEDIYTIWCWDAYNIPDSVLTSYYPWNADSIAVYVYDNRRSGVLDKEHLNMLVNELYNRDVEIDTIQVGSSSVQTSIKNIIGSGLPIPNFTFKFYHPAGDFFAEFYWHNEGQCIIDSSCGDPYKETLHPFELSDTCSKVYWRMPCPGTYDEIKKVIETQFDMSIVEGKYELDYEEDNSVKILDLELLLN